MSPIQIDKNTGIMYRVWKVNSPKAVFLLVHGLGAHTARWEFLSDFFLKNGISSYGIELKGFGKTKDLRGHINSFDIYFTDINNLYDIIKKENPGKKIFLLSESMGALISFMMIVKHPSLFDGLICISPAFKSNLKASPLDYIKVFSALLYNPKRQFNMPFDSTMCTRDVEYQKVIDSDPLDHHLATSKLLSEIIIWQIRAKILKDKIEVPVLFLVSGQDKLTNPQVSKIFFKGLKAKDKTIIEYPYMYHALSVDLDREKVFEDILKWTEKRRGLS